jgi:hypothetical protein
MARGEQGQGQASLWQQCRGRMIVMLIARKSDLEHAPSTRVSETSSTQTQGVCHGEMSIM